MQVFLKSLLSIGLLFTFTYGSYAQDPHLDIEGDARIVGRLDIHSSNSNVFVGTNSGENNTTGSDNTFFGVGSGINNTTGEDNAFFGRGSGRDNTAGYANTFIGNRSGLRNLTGGYNTFMGEGSGWSNITGYMNTFIGFATGQVSPLDSTDRAIALGHQARVACSNCAVIGGTGADTVHVGVGLSAPRATMHLRRPGQSNQQTVVQILQSDVSKRPLLLFSENDPTDGLDDGMSLEYDGRLNTGDNKLHINATGGSPMVTFMNNGMVGIGNTSPNDALDVSGDIDATGCIQTGDANFIGGLCVSDRRLKKNIRDLTSQLTNLKSLRPVSYQWRDPSRGQQEEIGLIAQEVEQVIPEMVVTESDGRKRIRYDLSLQIRLVKALQEQQEEIDALKTELSQLQQLAGEVAALKTQLGLSDLPANDR